MVKPIYFLKPASCGTHFAGLWPEQGLQPVTRATAFEAVDFTQIGSMATSAPPDKHKQILPSLDVALRAGQGQQDYPASHRSYQNSPDHRVTRA